MPSLKNPVGSCVILTAFVASLFVTVVPAMAQTETVLWNFNYDSPEGGEYPLGSLIFDAAGNLYGTTESGGSYGLGTVFELSPTTGGGWTETVLHSFDNNGTDGYEPNSGLVFDAAGNLYGTTSNGTEYTNCKSSCGTVFELSPLAGGGWAETVLYSFDGTPSPGVVVDAAGNLYGTTEEGYTGGCDGWGCGVVFELSPTVGGGWTEKTVYAFGKSGIGVQPEVGVVLDGHGNLYGSTAFAGSRISSVTAFELTPEADGEWNVTALHRFSDTGKAGSPTFSLTLDTAGDLYGVSANGMYRGEATAFELMPSADGVWSLKVLHNFGHNDDGVPSGGLILDAAGNLYGVMRTGGTRNQGAVYELSPSGETWRERILYSFAEEGRGALNVSPTGSLVFDSAGNLYGATIGAVFEIKP
jgi:uncharacterized repeat protein (TIGR03803 family)